MRYKFFISILKLFTILKSPKRNRTTLFDNTHHERLSSGLGDIKRASAYHRKKCAQMRYGNTTLSHLEVKKYNGKKYTQVIHMLSSTQKLPYRQVPEHSPARPHCATTQKPFLSISSASSLPSEHTSLPFVITCTLSGVRCSSNDG